MYVLNGELHGPIHVMVGGQWWMNETSTINSTFGGEFLLSSKYMWRQVIWIRGTLKDKIRNIFP